MNDFSGDLQAHIAGLLAADDWIRASGVRVLREDAADIRFLTDKALGQLSGVLAVIVIDRMTNNAPGVSIDFSVVCTECVPANRTGETYATAIETAQRVAQILDGQDVHWVETEHAVADGETGILQAISRFSCISEAL